MEESKKNIPFRRNIPRKEVKRMRHFVTHGYEIWLRYLRPDGRTALRIIDTPRELRLLLSRRHICTDWFAERKSVASAAPPQMQYLLMTREQMKRLVKQVNPDHLTPSHNSFEIAGCSDEQMFTPWVVRLK